MLAMGVVTNPARVTRFRMALEVISVSVTRADLEPMARPVRAAFSLGLNAGKPKAGAKAACGAMVAGVDNSAA